MVQRKQTRRIGTKTEKPKRQLSSHQQQDTGSEGGGGDLTRKMKNPLPLIRALDGPPNYMKATSSSHARKERLQVTVHSPITTTDKNRNPKLSNNSNFSKRPSPSLDGSGIKQVISLTRNSSLKPVRSSMKKSSVMGLYPKKNVNRATCSSTLKDSKFPEALDLNPGGTESEGDSIMKVCPYNYCSLNGHTHESVPLKSFLSARRRLVKNQRSMKLRRISSLLAISSTPSGLEINPLFEDVDNGFFVDIYDKPQTQIKQVESFKERSNQGKHERENVLDESSLMEDDWECTVNQIYETSSEINYKDDLDLTSNLSNEEMDLLINFLEYVECDPKFELKEAHQCLMGKDYADWDSDCYMVNASGNNNKGPAKSETNVSPSNEAIDSKTGDSEYLNDGFGPIFDPLLEIENASDGWSPVLLHEEEVTDNSNGTTSSPILSDGLYKKHGKDGIEEDSTILEVHLSDSPHGYTETAHNMPEFDCIEIEMEMEASKCDDEVEDPSVLENHNDISNDQSDESHIGRNQEKLDHERQEENKETDRSTSKPSKEYSTGLKETLKIRDDIISDVYGNYFAANINSAAEDGTFSTPALTSAHLMEAVSNPKARYNMIRRKTTEEVQEIQAFNPRPPRFLPVEDDQEAEKVDLRHQLADERKTAEKWMIDYALQQAVMKLAPDRKRKVELLVEAFETIMPLPICETTMQAISSLTHARPMQACS